MNKGLVEYSRSLASHYGRTLSEQEASRVTELAHQQQGKFGSLEARREAFDTMATFLVTQWGITPDRVVLAKYRPASLERLGLTPGERSNPLIQSDDIAHAPP